MTATGEVGHERAYYHCDGRHEGHFPFDISDGLRRDRLSAGLRPLDCLAAALASFRDGADDIPCRFGGVRLCASAVRAAARKAGAQLAARQRAGAVVVPDKPGA